MIIPPKIEKKVKISKRGTTLDIASTILPFIGYEGQIGLGRNLMIDESLESTLGKLSTHLPSWKDELMTFWNFPTIESGIKIIPENQLIEVNDRTFTYPLLMEIDNNLETTFKFDFFTEWVHKNLASHVEDIEIGKSFIWIDRCQTINKVFKVNFLPFDCVAMGKLVGDDNSKRVEGSIHGVDKARTIDKSTIERMISQ